MTIDMRYDHTRGHWCDFCQTFHSSQSCYHPGGQMLRMAEASINELQAQRDEAQEERDELKLKNDVATSNIRLYCDEIRDLKAKLAEAEQRVRELEREQGLHIEYVAVDEHGEELAAAEQRVRELEGHIDTMKGWLRERADLARQDGDIAEYGLRLAYRHLDWEMQRLLTAPEPKE